MVWETIKTEAHTLSERNGFLRPRSVFQYSATGPDVLTVFRFGSRHALVAFQKVEGRKRTGKLTSEELQALRIALRPLPRYTGYPHVEIDF